MTESPGRWGAGGHRRSTIARLLAAAVLAVSATACAQDDQQPTPAEERLGRPGAPGEQADLPVTGAFETFRFVDEEVTVPGRVRSVTGPGVFELEGDLLAEPVTVVAPPTGVIDPDASVRVTGTVVPVGELDERGLPGGVAPEAVRDLRGEHVILATEVRSVADVETEASGGGG